MIRNTKVNKSKGITVAKKETYLQQLKMLSSYITSGNIKLLDRLCSEADVMKHYNLKLRAIGHLIHYPKIIHYIDTYMNNNFCIESSDLRDVLFTVAIICQQYKLDNTNKLYFTKYKIDENSEFISIVEKYYDELGLELPSSGELESLLKLYTSGIITDEIIQKMIVLIEGVDKNNITSNFQQPILFTPTINEIKKEEDELIFDKLPIKIKEYIESVKDFLKNKRSVCRSCPLKSKGSVILDTNLNELGPVDIAIIGLNPGAEELKNGLPFVGKSGKLLRKYLNPLIEKYRLKYLITNSIMCSTNNAQDIEGITQVLKNCKPVADEIRRAFPAKLTIILGNETKNIIGIKGAISKLNGEYLDGYFIIIHPSSVLYNPNNLSKFEKAFQNLDKLLSDGKIIKIEEQIVQQNYNNINIPENKIISRFTTDLTLFDIRIINEKVVYIMKDTTGNKKYLIDDFQVPIYLKSGIYKDCHIIEREMDCISILSNEERTKLSKLLYYYNSKKE